MKKTKRILAVMLCLCMAMSILPVGAAATGATEVSVKFVDSNPGGFANTDTWTLSVNQAGVVAVTAKTASKSAEVLCTGDNWFAYDMGTLEAGYYDGYFSWLQFSGGGVFDFYIVPVSNNVVDEVNAAFASGIKPFTTLNGKASSNTDVSDLIGAVYLPQDGKYMLVGRRSRSDANTANYIYLYEFNMRKASDVILDKVSIDFTNVDAFNENKFNLIQYAAQDIINYESDKTPDNGIDSRCIDFYIPGGASHFIGFDLGYIEANDYNVTLTYAKAALGGKYSIYLVRTNSAITNTSCGGNPATDISYTVNSHLLHDWADNDVLYIGDEADGRLDFNSAETKYWQERKVEFKDVKAGRYYLVAHLKTTDDNIYAGKYGYLQGFDMVPADFEYATAGAEANAEGKALFGDNYAYIRKDGDAWVVNFFGGIKETQGYTEVGFEVNGVEYGSEQVYSKLNVGGQDINNADFGAGVGYIFSEEVALASAPDEIEFRAYAIAADGETRVYGNTYTAVIE